MRFLFLALLLGAASACTLPYAGPSCEYDCRDYCYRTLSQCNVDSCGIVTCMCSDHGQIDTATGLCVCDVGFAGLQCELHYQRPYESTCGDFQVQGHAIPLPLVYEVCNTTTNVARCSAGSVTYQDQVTSEMQPLQVCYPPDIGPIFLKSVSPNNFVSRETSSVHLTYSTTLPVLLTEFTFEYASLTSRSDFVIRNAHFPDQFLQVNESQSHSCGTGGTKHCRDVILTTLRSGREPTVWRLSGPPTALTPGATIEARGFPGWFMVIASTISSFVVISNDIAATSLRFGLAVSKMPSAVEIPNTRFVNTLHTVGPVLTGVPSLFSCMSHCLRETLCTKVQYNRTSLACVMFDSLASATTTPSTGIDTYNTLVGLIPCSFSTATGSYCNHTDLGPYLFSKASAGQSPLIMETLSADRSSSELRVEPTFASVLQRQWILQQVGNSSQVFIFLKDTDLVLNVNRLTSVGSPLTLELSVFDPDFSASWIMVPLQTNPLQVLFVLVDSLSDTSLSYHPYYLSTTPGLVTDTGVDVRTSLQPVSSVVLSKATWQLNVEIEDSRTPSIRLKKPQLTPIVSLPLASEIQCNSLCRLLEHRCTFATSTSSALCELYSDLTSPTFTSCTNCVTYYRSPLTVGAAQGVYDRYPGGSGSCTNDAVYRDFLSLPVPQPFTPKRAESLNPLCWPLQMNPVRLKHVQTALVLDGANALFTYLRPFQSDFQSVNHLAFVQDGQVGVYRIYTLPEAPSGNLEWFLTMDPTPGVREVYFQRVDAYGAAQNPARWHVRDVQGTSGRASTVYIENADSRGWFLGVSAGKLVAIEGTHEIETDDGDVVWDISTTGVAGQSDCGVSTCLSHGTLTSASTTVLASLNASNEVECRIACKLLTYGTGCTQMVFALIDAYHGNCTLYKSAATWSSVSSTPFVTCCYWTLAGLQNTYIENGVVQSKRCLVPAYDPDNCASVRYSGVVKASVGPNVYPVPEVLFQSYGEQQFYSSYTNLPADLVVFSPGIASRPFSIYIVDGADRGKVVAYNTFFASFVAIADSAVPSPFEKRLFNFTETIATNLPPSPIYVGNIGIDDAQDINRRVNLADERQCISLCLAQVRACVAMTFDTAISSKICTLFSSFVSSPLAVGLTQSAANAPTVLSWIRDQNKITAGTTPYAPTTHDFQLRTLSNNVVGTYRFIRSLGAFYPPQSADGTTTIFQMYTGPTTDSSCTRVCSRWYSDSTGAVHSPNFPSSPTSMTLSGLANGEYITFVSLTMRSPTTFSVSVLYKGGNDHVVFAHTGGIYAAYLCHYGGQVQCISASIKSGNEDSCLYIAQDYDPARCELSFSPNGLGV